MKAIIAKPKSNREDSLLDESRLLGFTILFLIDWLVSQYNRYLVI
jgi:hypothetical protein